VIRDSAGNLYGTTTFGGAANAGVVFKVNASGRQALLYSFTGGADGSQPRAGLIRDSAGNLYGTTVYGGTAGLGVVFKVNTAGQETVLYNFCSLEGCADGYEPFTGVIRDQAGNLYGTTEFGGTPGRAGVVYKISPSGQETVLYSFTGGTDGGAPAGLVRDSAGNLYGTALTGGTAGAGVVFEVSASGQETVLYNFTGGADGGNPFAGVIRDSAGNLYGTTGEGGTAGAGVVFEVNASGQETVLYSFTGGADGAHSFAGLVEDSAGNLYGTTLDGGTAGAGVVFKVAAAGGQTVLYSFPGLGYPQGGYPQGGVILDSASNLYGTTSYGGAGGTGVVFKLDTAGQETVVYSFPGTADGGNPMAGLIRDSAGNLYGTTYQGGTAGAGVVFKVSAAGHETVLYTFTGGSDGGYPQGGVIRDPAGNLYGTTVGGGAAGAGTVFKVDAAGGESVLYSFTGGADGGYPYASVVRDSAGNLYGTTVDGGTAGAGVVFKLDTTGQETVLHNFTGYPDDGGNPYAGVALDSHGNLYGTTAFGGAEDDGVVYKVGSAGQENVILSFTYGPGGCDPQSGVILDSAGNLYGTTSECGAAGYGVVYKVARSGEEAVLYSFCSLTACADGTSPGAAGVIRDSSGNLYGTTGGGGTAGYGVVWELGTSGQETVLYSFTGGSDGGDPFAGVIRDSAGNLYGTTRDGGAKGAGVVFKLVP
jgi:uncharacterized repeat protein (TIGR03803 family)